MTIATPSIIEAIKDLRNTRGIIAPVDVVNAARPVDSPLHEYFEWDDGVAADAYRIVQAQLLLRVTVTMLAGANGEMTNVRAFVSLTSEQGYRSTVDVLADTSHRSQLIADAMRDMQIFKRKYGHLKELADVFAAMEHVGVGRARRSRTG